MRNQRQTKTMTGQGVKENTQTKYTDTNDKTRNR